MASTREERIQQRLRGAQRREVKEVDFGLAFPIAQAPVSPIAPSQRSPKPNLPVKSITPAARNNSHSDAEQEFGGEQSRTLRSGNIDANISAKRRKLDTDYTPLSSRNTGLTRATAQPDIYSLPDDDPEPASGVDNPEVLPADEAIQVALLHTYEPEPIQTISADPAETATTSPPLATARRSVRRQASSPINSIGTKTTGSIRPIDQQLGATENVSPIRAGLATPVPRAKRKRGHATPTPPNSISQDRHNQSIQKAPSNYGADELSPSQTVPRLRKQNSLAGHVSSAAQENGTQSSEAGKEEAEAIDDSDAAAILGENRSRRISRDIQASASPVLDEVEAAPKPPAQGQRRRQHKISSPSKQRHPKLPSKAKSQNPKQPSKTAKLRDGSPIPVTVHRLTEQPLWEEDESDAEILNSEIPYSKRPGVNAVDVLSQVCQEIIGSGLETLEDGRRHADDSSLRREYKTKWNAVKSFGEELQSRLLAQTINLDNAYSLEKRVREENKRKQALREEILRIREERQRVAVRMDEIRIAHEHEAKDSQERDALNSIAYDMELAIDSGRSQAAKPKDNSGKMAGIELMLKRVASQISNKGDTGGFLKQIKEFNGFLERAASALASRTA